MQNITVTRITCGKIYILSNNKFSLICKFCESDFFTLEDLRGHLNEHFPGPPTTNFKYEDSISCGSDESVPKEHGRTDFKDIVIKVEAGPELINEESSSCLNNQLNDEPILSEPQSNSSNENENTAEPTDMKGARSNRYPKRLRKGIVKSAPTPMILDEVNQTKVTKRKRRTERSNKLKHETHSTLNVVPADPKESKKSGFKCTYCKKIFNTKDYLSIHENTHTGKRPFECRVCSRTFGNPRCLLRHMDTHADAPKYQCSVCKKKFVEGSKLTIHTREKHLPDTDPRRFFSCRLCDVKLKSCMQQRKHRRTHNIKSPIFVCDYCRKEFKRKDVLVRHMVTHNGQTPFNCNNCKRPFSWLGNKLKHEKICAN